MPLYDYQCAKCGAVFEVRQKFSDAPITIHEGCGGEVTKLLSAPAFHLKGGGWYITDYARGGSSGKNEAEKPDSSESRSETKTESKPAETKTETKTESKPAATVTKTE
jgi:putative FmdB family regulatory protein